MGRIYYLKKYLQGSAREVVGVTSFLNSEEAYNEAKTLLEQRYINPFIPQQIGDMAKSSATFRHCSKEICQFS